MYAYAKAVNKGYIDPKYRAVAEKAFKGLKSKLMVERQDGTLTLTRCCQVGGIRIAMAASNIISVRRCGIMMQKQQDRLLWAVWS